MIIKVEKLWTITVTEIKKKKIQKIQIHHKLKSFSHQQLNYSKRSLWATCLRVQFQIGNVGKIKVVLKIQSLSERSQDTFFLFFLASGGDYLLLDTFGRVLRLIKLGLINRFKPGDLSSLSMLPRLSFI